LVSSTRFSVCEILLVSSTRFSVCEILLVSSTRFSVCEIFNCRLSPEGVDIFLDCLCGEECNRGYSLLKPMGKYILYGKYRPAEM